MIRTSHLGIADRFGIAVTALLSSHTSVAFVASLFLDLPTYHFDTHITPDCISLFSRTPLHILTIEPAVHTASWEPRHSTCMPTRSVSDMSSAAEHAPRHLQPQLIFEIFIVAGALVHVGMGRRDRRLGRWSRCEGCGYGLALGARVYRRGEAKTRTVGDGGCAGEERERPVGIECGCSRDDMGRDRHWGALDTRDGR
ncbi:hypothetical protein R3P38DRAFT_1206236 [Favolaschia claudopus]|uniref:Uncharacterized protein n=1 Tax=Favolaschia claudopus TaxID=2862362 RepID=A0AAW0B3E9_9AGAR